MSICGGCGTENEVGRKFCGECGSRLAAVCPACGTTNAPTAKFCGECASPLVAGLVAPADRPLPAGPAAATAAQAGPASPVAERRLVSILFADLVGFTTLAEGRDAEDTRELLSRYFDLSRDVVGRYGGTVEKFIGDAVMAVWGAPVAHEDDAERAVRAALELVDAVKGLGTGIAARAGVLTGEAAVTIGATNQGMVAGDIVNTASRLQSVAAPGTVLVGEGTERAASRAIAFEAAGEQALKGKAAPVPAWRAVRVIAQVGGRNRSETLEAPFVGRDDELRLLKDLYHATAREQRARLVSVIGPAGIGKSRLAWEFRKYEDGLVETVWFHEGRSPAYGDGISFWALGEMVRRRAGLLETDDDQTTRVKVAATVAEHVPDPAERRWIEQALLALLGLETGGTASDELFAAWRMFFERLAATAPVVLVFEDFHHADSGLIDFVEHMLEWSRTFPIYILTLARPDFLERRADWGAGKRSFTSIFLEPLAPDAMQALLAGLVPGLPQSAARAIVERADGIPLYAVETVRMLLSEGKLTLSGGAYQPTGDLTSLAIPETLTALIASRLDGLSPADRALVSDAAVLGQSFTIGGLTSVSGLEEEELAGRLRALVTREILTLQTDPRSPERGQYAFVQALIREVAYNALAKRDRKVRHLAAARFFESLDTDELAGGLAGHYLAAYRNSAEGPEADAVGAQARIALTAAAHRAIDLGSFDQAQTFLEQALAVTTDKGETAALLERAGEAASAAARREAAEAHLRRAISEYRELGELTGIIRATAALGRCILDSGRVADALAVLEPAVIEFGDLPFGHGRIALEGQLARAYFFADDNRRAVEIADRVLDAAEHADLAAVVADTLVTKGTALATLGRPIEGLGAIAAGRELAEASGLGVTVLRADNNRAFSLAGRDPRAGLAASRDGLALARRLGARGWVPGMIQNLGEFGMRTGDWAMAMAELTAALAEDFEGSDLGGLLVSYVQIAALRGDPIESRLDEFRLLGGDEAFPQEMANRAVAKGFSAFASGDLATARAAWLEAAAAAAAEAPTSVPRAARAALWSGDVAGAIDDVRLLEQSELHGAAFQADLMTVRAGVAALEGRRADAMSLYRDSLRAWRDLGLAWDEALCELDMVLLLGPDDPEIRAAGEAARQILARLEAAPILARLDTALDTTGRAVAARQRPVDQLVGDAARA
ncbi:MAG TPA: adenylate/guanylate cyclase domain-containing protein [Candidatus Limnocylindrales bacterium]